MSLGYHEHQPSSCLSLAQAFLVQDADGTRRPPHVGEHCCKRPALAATLRAVADQGPDVLYRGPMAATLVDELNAHGGAFTLDDLRQAEVEVVEPVKTEVFGMTYLGVGPPSSGGAAVRVRGRPCYPRPVPVRLQPSDAPGIFTTHSDRV